MPSQIETLAELIRRKPPTAPDGLTDAEAAGVPSTNDTSILHDLFHLSPSQAETIIQAITTIVAGDPLDDKELLLEHGVNMLQTLPSNSGLGDKVSKDFIKLLYHDLPHPPSTVAGATSRYRRHDGGGNNPWLPELGKASSPYSRNVPPMKAKGPNLPDPELVFENLLKRKGDFRPHPSGLNRLFFSFATIVIHECFQTARPDKGEPTLNETSSYVDLSTLYGNTCKEQERVRTYENGKIWPDSIASERIMMMPPGVVALLVMFSRNHNSIAESLLSINEEGKYGPWKPEEKLKWESEESKKKWMDEDVFQISRNINVGFFATIVLHDYVAAILNTPRANSTWCLNLGEEIKQRDGNRVERGTGNVVSVEFAVLYHWHAALSAADAAWMEKVWKDNICGYNSPDDITPKVFYEFAECAHKELLKQPAKEWVFGGIERGKDGRFPDHKLAEIIISCVDEPAHAFGAHGTPASLKIVDILGMLQARNHFNVCTMNEFRRYLNLKAYNSFEEWNPDKETARAAQLLYGHIDNLELYPGLMAECTKPSMPGSGVCPGQTTGRGILDDAVALVRGDRFLSTDLNSSTLTNWGLSKISSSIAPGSYGGLLPHLLFSGLPSGFSGLSTYALLPFYTPKAVQGILKANGVADMYNYEKPSGREIVSIQTQEGCKHVFEDRENFRTMYQPAIRNCTNGHEFMIGWDEQKKHDERSKILHHIFFEDGFEAHVTKFFRENVAQRIKKSSLAYPDGRRSIDIVRDVTNVTPIMWLAQRFAIPIKSQKNPDGLISLPELFEAYLCLFMYQSFNILPVHEWRLREGSLKAAPLLRKVFEANLSSQQGFKESLVDWLAKGTAYEVGPDADRIYHELNKTKLPVGDLVGDCIGMSAPVAGNLTQQASLLIDLFLSEGYEKYKERIVELAHKDDEASEKELQGFVFEGMRHAGIVPGLPRVAAKDITVTDGSRGTIEVKAHQTVLIATSKAAMDSSAFPNPEQLDPHRPLSSYTLLGHGLHYCFGARLIAPALAATLKEVFKLKCLKRAPNRSGKFSMLEHEVAGIKMRSYLDANSKESPIPTTLTLIYEE